MFENEIESALLSNRLWPALGCAKYISEAIMYPLIIFQYINQDITRNTLRLSGLSMYSLKP